MGLTRRRDPKPSKRLLTRPVQRRPIFLQGMKVPIVSAHKFLGMMVNKELHWKEHVDYALEKGTKWVTQYRRLPSH